MTQEPDDAEIGGGAGLPVPRFFGRRWLARSRPAATLSLSAERGSHRALRLPVFLAAPRDAVAGRIVHAAGLPFAHPIEHDAILSASSVFERDEIRAQRCGLIGDRPRE